MKIDENYFMELPNFQHLKMIIFRIHFLKTILKIIFIDYIFGKICYFEML